MSSVSVGGKNRGTLACSSPAAVSMMSRPTAYDGKVAGLYDLGDTLGRGHFAVVKLARHVFTGEKVAVKVIDKTKLDEVSRAHLFQEVRCMKLVQHPNVVRLYEVIDTQTKLYLILELGDGGDMYDYIMRHEKGLDDEAARKYFAQIVHAISYCHRLHVVHRDLKPENVVFFEKLGMVKLTDFGFSNRFCPGQKLETSCGSLAYSAPEILLGDSYDAPAVDVWSLGVILYMLVCGHAPFQEANDSETLTMIMDCKYTIPSHVSVECSRLIRRLLIRDPEKRATLEEIADDPWLRSVSNVQHADYLPLVSREHLSEEDHAHILQKMANGNIASQEEIVCALDKNAYNHITATYFLLAERKLRALRQEQAQLLNATQLSGLAALAISPRNPCAPCPSGGVGGGGGGAGGPPNETLPRTVEGLVSPQEARRALVSKVASVTGTACALDLPPSSNCHCRSRSTARLGLGTLPFLVRDELLKTSSTTSLTHAASRSTDGETNVAIGNATSKVKRTTFKETTTTTTPTKASPCCEDGPNCGNGGHGGGHSLPSSVVRATLQSQFAANKFKPVTAPNNRKLHSVRSSPQLTLNEIYEEIESDCEVNAIVNQSSFVPSANSSKMSTTTRVLQSQLSVASPAVLRKYEQQRRLYAKARTASCSSSDASDDDSADTRKRKADKLKQRVSGGSYRGGGHWEDDNDPNNGPPGSGGGGGGVGGCGGGGGEARASGDAGQREPNSEERPPPSSPGHERPSSSPERRRPVDESCTPDRADPSNNHHIDTTATTTATTTTSSSSSSSSTGSDTRAVSKLTRQQMFEATSFKQHVHSWPSESSSSSSVSVSESGNSSSLQATPSRSRSPASIVYSVADHESDVCSTTNSPPPSPLSSTPNITSLRQSKTLSQLNRYVASTAAHTVQTAQTLPQMVSSSAAVSGGKENRQVSWMDLRAGPLHFLNLKRTNRHRATSHVSSSSLSANSAPEIGVTTNGHRNSYKHRLYRLLKHAPHLGSGCSTSTSSSAKRWDINRNGLDVTAQDALAVVDSSSSPPPHDRDTQRYTDRGGGGRRASSRTSGSAPPTTTSGSSSTSSHSKCCSLC